MEATATLAAILQKFDFHLCSKPEEVGMKTGNKYVFYFTHIQKLKLIKVKLTIKTIFML
jgi:hypothetical protein